MYFQIIYTLSVFLQVIIVIFVIFAGAFEVDVSNWSPFAPNGAKAILTGATVVFFAYVGFDAVANSAEESKEPQVYYMAFTTTINSITLHSSMIITSFIILRLIFFSID